MKRLLWKLLTIFGGTLAVLILTVIIFYFWASSGSYPQNKYDEIVKYNTSKTPTSQLNNNKDTKDVFTVVTYNIGYLSGLTNNLAVETNQKLFDDNLKNAIAALKPLNADFIGLQEIDLASKRSFKVNQVEKVAQGLSFPEAAIGVNWDKNYVAFPYFPISAHFGRIVSSQAILSRYPIESHQRIVLEKVADNPFYYNAFYIDRVAQVSKIKVQNRTLVLINVHLEAFNKNTRLEQTKFIENLLEKYINDFPILLVGDFNSTPANNQETEPTINLLLNNPNLKSATPQSSFNDPKVLTFPADKPEAKLDYIFYTPKNIEVLEWQVVSEAKQASDHLPVMMKFRFK
ncbi:MAG: endonuclease/exonuclease/phosphatase family protein [Cyanobacteria bacterium P01_A01_bin.45]